MFCLIYNTELKDWRINICLRKSEVIVERISVCNVIKKLMEHGICCLPCSYTNDVIEQLSWQLRLHINFRVMSSGCHSVKVLSTSVCNSIVATVTDP